MWGVFFAPFYARLRFGSTAIGLFSVMGEIRPIAFLTKKINQRISNMKKLTTTVLYKGKEKAISVWLDDETASIVGEIFRRWI